MGLVPRLPTAPGGCRSSSLGLHAPALHSAPFHQAEDDVFDQEAENDHGQQSGEHAGYVELVLTRSRRSHRVDGPMHNATALTSNYPRRDVIKQVQTLPLPKLRDCSVTSEKLRGDGWGGVSSRRIFNSLNSRDIIDDQKSGGESGIRTHGTLSRTHAFQACALSHSAISPEAPSVGDPGATSNGFRGFCKSGAMMKPRRRESVMRRTCPPTLPLSNRV
jgi:hypothetical protein